MSDDRTALMPRIPGWELPRTDPWGEDLDPPGVLSHRARRWASYAWAVPAAVMAAVGSVWIDRPGLWSDEFATWGMAGLSWPESVAIMRYVDAVLGPYYALILGWAHLFGDSDVALRVPSLIAMTLAAGLVGAIGNRLAGPRVGLFAGLLFAVLPGASRYAQEARPYALVVLAAALSTYILVRILDRPRIWWFLAYVPAVAVLGLSHIVALVLLVGHGWLMMARCRRYVPAWAVAALIGVLPSLPLLRRGYDQRNQVAWIDAYNASPTLFIETAFGAVVVAVIIAALAMFSLPLRYPSSVYAAWAALPVATLIAVSQVMPLMLPRYLIFTLPAWALLAGAALARLHPGVAAVALVVIAALTVPAHLEIRGSGGHEDDTRGVAAVISGGYRDGDAIVYAAGDAFRGSGWVPRDIVAHYVPAERRPFDVFMRRPQRTGGQLLAVECEDFAACLGTPAPERVWVVRLYYLEDPLTGMGERKEQLIRERYRTERLWRPRNFTVALLVNSPLVGVP